MTNNKEKLRQEFIKAVQDAEMTEQPYPNLVYDDGDLEEAVEAVGFTYHYEDGKFIAVKDNQKIEFDYERIPPRHPSEHDEMLIKLYD